jgi:hypothetical protein
MALWLRRMPAEIGGLNPDQLHRFEGIFIYFGFLLLLFVISEKIGSGKTSGLFRQSFFPLLVYYTTMLGIPLLNGAYRRGTDFWEHSLFVLLIPFLLIVLLAVCRFYRQRRLVASMISLVIQRLRRSGKINPAPPPVEIFLGGSDSPSGFRIQTPGQVPGKF